MKEFKKWEGTHSPGEYAYQRWEDAWKAALEWAENLFVQLNSFEVEETINKELREE